MSVEDFKVLSWGVTLWKFALFTVKPCLMPSMTGAHNTLRSVVFVLKLPSEMALTDTGRNCRDAVPSPLGQGLLRVFRGQSFYDFLLEPLVCHW